MSAVERAKSYLESKGSIILLSTGDILCDGVLYSPRRVRGGTIWISENKLAQLKKSNGILLAVSDDSIVEIPASEVPKSGGEVNGITIKVVDSKKVRIKISRDLKAKLDTIADDPERAIKILLSAYQSVIDLHPINQSNVLLSIIGAIKTLRNSEYVDIISRIEECGELNLAELTEDEVRIVKELASYRIVFIDNRYDGEYAKVLCKFAVEHMNDEVLFRIGFGYDFCRVYCSRFESCEVRKENKTDYFGFRMRFKTSDFAEKSPEELVAIWLAQCAQKL